MLKFNERLEHFNRDPIESKEDGISAEQKELMGYKMKDDTFIETEGKDESKSGITKNLMDKLKQNKDEADKPQEEKKDDAPKEDAKKDEAPNQEEAPKKEDDSNKEDDSKDDAKKEEGDKK